MPPRDPGQWMWAEACELLDRAERLHRQFFQPRPTTRGPVWDPPVDVFETEHELWVIVALPGVAAKQVEVIVGRGALLVSGERSLPVALRGARIQRMEIPQGRFERQIPLPAYQFEVGRRQIVNGCLILSLRKLGRVMP